jgi:hypothetical protein
MSAQNTNLFKRTKAVFLFFLSLAFFLTNVIGLHATESSIWTERRAAARRLNGGDTVTDSVSSEKLQLLAQLPQTAQVRPFSTVDLFTATNVKTNSNLRQTTPSVPDWVSSLVLPYGSIRNVHLSKNSDAPLVIHVQDAHEVEEAQLNTASMIEGLTSHAGVALVGIEGAEGSFDFQPYRIWPDKKATKSIAEHFLKMGYLGGAEYAAITLPNPPVLWGVEALETYLEHIKAYQDAIKLKPGVDKWLQGIEAQAEPLKAKIYSDDLKIFDRHYRAYKEEREGLGDFISMLFSFADKGAKESHPNLQILSQALDAEKFLDFKQVEKERLQMVEALAAKLPKAELDGLVQKSLDYRAGRMGYGDFHQSLKNLCRAYGVHLSSYEQFNAYVDYVLLSDKIDRNALLGELEGMEDSVPLSLAKTSKQKGLVIAIRYIAVLKKLTNHQMTPADWAYYSAYREDIARIGDKVSALGGSTPSSLEAVSLVPFEDFCRLAVRRNETLVGNLLDKMRKENAKTSFLIAGGFHTDGMMELLAKRGASYLVVTPKIIEIPKENHSLDVFVRDPIPLERLFAGDKIYLKSWLPTADAAAKIGGPAAARAETLQESVASLQTAVFQLEGGNTVTAQKMAGSFPLVEQGKFAVSPMSVRGGYYEFPIQVDGDPILLTAAPKADNSAQTNENKESLPLSLDRLQISTGIGEYEFNQCRGRKSIGARARHFFSARKNGTSRRKGKPIVVRRSHLTKLLTLTTAATRKQAIRELPVRGWRALLGLPGKSKKGLPVNEVTIALFAARHELGQFLLHPVQFWRDHPNRRTVRGGLIAVIFILSWIVAPTLLGGHFMNVSSSDLSSLSAFFHFLGSFAVHHPLALAGVIAVMTLSIPLANIITHGIANMLILFGWWTYRSFHRRVIRSADREALGRLLHDSNFAEIMANWLNDAYNENELRKVPTYVPFPLYDPKKANDISTLTNKEVAIGSNLAGFYALDAALDALRAAFPDRRHLNLLDILTLIIEGKDLRAEEAALLLRVSNATWMATQPFRGLKERIARKEFSAWDDQTRELQYSYMDLLREAAKIVRETIKWDETNYENEFAGLLKNIQFAERIAQQFQDSYNRVHKTSYFMYAAEEKDQLVGVKVQEVSIGVGLATFYAFVEGADEVVELRRLFGKPRAGYREVLWDIVNRRLSNEEQEILMTFANATWKATQAFRSLESRIMRPVFTRWNLLSDEEKEKDMVQVRAAASLLLGHLPTPPTLTVEEAVITSPGAESELKRLSPEGQRLAQAMGESLPIDFDALVGHNGVRLAAVHDAISEVRGNPDAGRRLIIRISKDADFRADAALYADFIKGLRDGNNVKPDWVAVVNLNAQSENEWVYLQGYFMGINQKIRLDPSNRPRRIEVTDRADRGFGILSPVMEGLMKIKGLVEVRRGEEKAKEKGKDEGKVFLTSDGQIDVPRILMSGDLAGELNRLSIQPVTRNEGDLSVEGLRVVLGRYFKNLTEQITQELEAILAAAIAA